MIGVTVSVSTIAGPFLGGLLTDQLSWRWIFLINLPLGLAAITLLAMFFPKPGRPPARPSMDYVGAVLLVGGLIGLVFCLAGNVDRVIAMPVMWCVALFSLALLAAFVANEAIASEPILPLALFRAPVVGVASALSFLLGIGLFGSVTYLPLYLQVANGMSASASGLILVPMAAGTLFASFASGASFSRTGRYRIFPIVGSGVTCVALTTLAILNATVSPAVAPVIAVALGIGAGITIQVLVLAVQNAAPREQVGVATSTASLFRAVGATIGVSAFWAILTIHSPSELSSIGSAFKLGRDDREGVRQVIESLHLVFGSAAVLTALAFCLSWFLPDPSKLEAAEARCRDRTRGRSERQDQAADTADHAARNIEATEPSVSGRRPTAQYGNGTHTTKAA
ncbi:MFS transporter [Mesorhizobium sp. M1227]|uniref:MFS transporter n=1 Tax=Mesorhizobium sp. M1227 TaxID=2957071 RepID=UPI003336C81C